MNRYTPLMILLLTTLLLTSCDALGIKSKIPKCDDPQALELTANLIRLNSGMRDPLFGLPVNLIADHSLATTEMILNQGIDKEIGKASCLASFVFTSRSKEPTTDTCKYVSRTGYELQNDTTGQLVSTIAELGPLSCVKFTQEEVTSLTRNPTDPSRQFDLGLKYYNGDGVPKNDAEAVKWYRLAADRGNADAQNSLGFLYSQGEGVAENDAEAVKWYRLAAAQGQADAQNNLGVAYRDGYSVPKSYAEAVKWFRLAADQGSAGAQSNLGAMYDNGRGVTVNDTEAVKWYRRAANQGLAAAQYNLGVMYENGEGVAKNNVEAVKWFRLAADQGDALAQYYLGVMYENGEGVAKNNVEAVKWFRLAADQGDAPAQSTLGWMYAYGRGVQRDVISARGWWGKTVSSDADDVLKTSALYSLGESFYAGEEFGSVDNMAQAKIFWKRVIEVGMTTEQSHKLASAGLACLERGESSKDCQPLRCSIEGRSDCPDL